MPSPSCSLTPEEQWRRNQQANKAYRQRGPVQPGAEAAATPIAARLELVLKRVDDQDLRDLESVSAALRAAGMAPQYGPREKSGRDVGRSGVILAFEVSDGSSYACVVGEVTRPQGHSVQVVGGIADGGCLPAV